MLDLCRKVGRIRRDLFQGQKPLKYPLLETNCNLVFQLLLCLSLIGASPAYSKDPGYSNQKIIVNYAYAAQLGFGGYNVGGLSVNIYHIPFAWTFPISATDQPWELKVKAPIGYGRFRFSEQLDSGSKISADVDTLSFGSGLELRVPLLDFWSLKPFGDFGLVTQISSNTSSSEPSIELDASFPLTYYYTLGVKSLLQHDWRDFTFGFGNALIYAANEAFDGSGGQSFGSFEAGIDARHPLGFEIGKYKPDADIFFIYYHFFSPVTFTRYLEVPLEIENQYEFGLAFGLAKPSKIWFLEDPRIGGSYIFADGLNAFRLTLGFPF